MPGPARANTLASVQRLVTDDWRGPSRDPIRLSAGDPVGVGHRDDTWPRYRWCTAADGTEGWVPDDVLQLTANGWVARADYDATELTVERGDVVEALRFLADWCWCRAADGSEGWLPEEVLADPAA